MYSSLQIGRAVAAIFVVLFHLGGAMSSDRYFNIQEFYIPFSFGGAGVDFFFVLSGFIIYTAHKNDFSNPLKLPNYIKKRFIRIFPSYWIIFISVYLVTLFTSSSSVLPTDILTIVKSLLLAPQDINVVGGTGAPVIAVAWSLQYEILFYIFFAFLILNRFIVVGFVLLVIYSYVEYFEQDTPFPMSILTSDYIFLFLMGMIISQIVKLEFKNIYIRLLGIAGFSLFFTLAFDTIGGYDFLKQYNIILYGLSSSMIIVNIVKTEDMGYNFKKFKLLNLFGDASYSLYLLHYPVIVLLCKVFVFLEIVKLGLIAAILAYIFIFLASLGVSLLFHIRIEKPLIKFLSKEVI